MSEGILKALMQLFALVAFPTNESGSRRSIVKTFLTHQLNNQLAEEYLKMYDKFYVEHQRRFKEKDRLPQRIASSSVKVLKIASEINEELTHYQKLILTIQLVEFLKSGWGINMLENEFIDHVALALNIDPVEYESICDFIIQPFENQKPALNILIISDQTPSNQNFRHLYWANLNSEVRILNVESAKLFLMRYDGNVDLTNNGQLVSVNRIHVIRPGSSLRHRKIDPIFYSDISSQFTNDIIETPVSFDVKELEYHFSKKKIGLYPVTFSTQSGKLVGIMGDSGSGKTTLINLLCGIYKPSSGQVTINGVDIHQRKSKIEGLIGYVSQDDLLMEDLTVFQNLYYNAKLCFDDLQDNEIRTKVLGLLESLGLFEAKDMKVGSPLEKNISGGQRKRLNIGLELIREPSVLFLDEPTSGLSSRDSENIIDLLKELAIKGKLVFVVIHQPSSDIFKMFNQLLVLDTGGYLIYNGDAVESINYFKTCINHVHRDENECLSCGNVNAEQVLNIINMEMVDEYGNFSSVRKIEPIDWYLKHIEFSIHKNIGDRIHERPLPKVNFKVPDRLKQFLVFFKRDVLSKLANRQYLLINLLETPVLAFILALIIRYYNVDANNFEGYNFSNNPNLSIFIVISIIIAFFVGLTLSAEEIINDRKILQREAFLNLSRFSYLLSKLVILGGITAVQMGMFVLIGNQILAIKGMFVYYWIALFSTAVFANILGLIISDSFKKTVNIYILIPFLVIPQLILNGVFVSYDRLNPKLSSPDRIPWFGELITSRWAFEAIAAHQYSNNKYQQIFYDYDKQKSQSHFKKEFWYAAMVNKLDKCNRLYDEHNNAELYDGIALIKKELQKENANNRLPKFSRFDLLDTMHYSMSVYTLVKQHLDNLRSYYRKSYNVADIAQDRIKREMVSTPELRAQFLKLKADYYNENLERLIRDNSNLFSDKIIEYNGVLVQKIDPIYKDPESHFLKAHYFSPYKNLWGQSYPTYWVNIGVIWVTCLLLFLILYFKVLDRFFHLGKYLKAKTLKKKNEMVD